MRDALAVAMLVVYGVLIIMGGIGNHQLAGVVLGADFVILGLLIVADRVRCARVRPPPPCVIMVDGVATTAVLSDPVVFLLGIAVMVALALPCFAWAVLAALAGSPEGAVGAVLLTVLGMWLMVSVVLVKVGRLRPVGLWFTSEGLAFESGGLQGFVRWGDVQGVGGSIPHCRAFLVTRPWVTVQQRSLIRPWYRVRIVSPDVAMLNTKDLALDPEHFLRVITHYARRPEACAELGTPASLATIDALREVVTGPVLPRTDGQVRPGCFMLYE